MPKLTIEEGGRSTAYEILDEVILIGRREGVSVRLSDPQAGVEHCQIRLVPGVGFKLVDLESRHGTKVNGAYVNQHVLADGDVIQIGEARLRFSGAAVAAAVQAPPQRAAVGAAPPPAVAPPGRGAVSPAMAREERERRPYRRRPSSDTPLILTAAAAGVVLLLVLVVWVGGAWFGASKNEKVYQEMVRLLKQDRYRAALAKADEGDPAGDQDGWRKIQAQKQYIQNLLQSGNPLENGKKAQDEYTDIQAWIQDHRKDVSGAIERWRAYEKKWKTAASFWAGEAKRQADTLERGGRISSSGATAVAAPEYPAPKPEAGSQATPADVLSLNWKVSSGVSRRLVDADRFQDAINALFVFWDKNQLRTGSRLEEWKKKVDDAVEAVQVHASNRWTELELKARKLAGEGKTDPAIALMQRVVDRFGIEKYRALAKEQIAKFRRR